jgi:hypothetical protein
MSSRLLIVEKFLWRWGLIPPKPQTRPVPSVKPLPTATTKSPAPSPIRTFGTGQEKMDVYGAIPLSPEDVQRVQAEAKKAALEHEAELRAPIKSYQTAQPEFGCAGSMGVTDPAVARAVADWDAKQEALFRPFRIGEITSTSPIKTLHN